MHTDIQSCLQDELETVRLPHICSDLESEYILISLKLPPRLLFHLLQK